MKTFTKKILTTVILITVISFSVNAQTNVSGGIFSNTTWTLANSPYIVTDTVVVFPSITLTIEPGVTVKFYDHTYLEIRWATLIAIGTLTDSITFTSNSLSPTPGIWGATFDGGIWLNSALVATSFNFCHIEYATIGIYNGNAIHIKNSVFINNLMGLNNIFGVPIDSCIFKFNAEGINWVDGCAIHFCNFLNNMNGIGELTGGSMVNCIIDSNQIGLGDVDGAKIYNCFINYNQTGLVSDPCCGGNITVKNCIIDYNSTMGVGIYGHGEADSVINNEIKFNGTGLEFATCPNFGSPSQCTKNVIDNNTIGIKVGGCPDIYCNSICYNTSYDLQNNWAGTYNFPNNYWCTTDSATVEAHIYDGYDNTSLGLVSFMPLDTLQCYAVTGIPSYETQPASFSIFPNPAADYLTVVLPATISKTEIKIFNMLGELAYSSEATKQKTTIDISTLNKGAYIIQISTAGRINRQKLIRQ
jgi:hypothetical protein